MTVLVTGANRGIGAGILAAYRAQGFDALGTSRHADDLLDLDVTDAGSFAALATTLTGKPINTLICNAGVFQDRGERLDSGYNPELWAAGMAANVAGVFLTIQTLLPNLRAAENAKIAIISSQMGSNARAKGGDYIYRASKAAVTNLGSNLAIDLAPENIAVGMYHPGWVRTDMGGGTADISVDQSVDGLMARFAALGIATTGCFETWDGQVMPF